MLIWAVVAGFLGGFAAKAVRDIRKAKREAAGEVQAALRAADRAVQAAREGSA